MMFELDQRIAEQLTEVALNSAVQVRCGNSNAFMVTASTIIPLMQMFEMGGVYISANRGAVEIIQAFESIGMDVSNIQFIDLVSSGILGGTDVPYSNIHFVDSPIMLESVLLRTLYILRTTTSVRNFVFLDSVNALAIYNEDVFWQNTFTPSSTPSASEKFSLLCSMCQTKPLHWCYQT